MIDAGAADGVALGALGVLAARVEEETLEEETLELDDGAGSSLPPAPPKASAGPGVAKVPKLDQMSGNLTLS